MVPSEYISAARLLLKKVLLRGEGWGNGGGKAGGTERSVPLKGIFLKRDRQSDGAVSVCRYGRLRGVAWRGVVRCGVASRLSDLT